MNLRKNSGFTLVEMALVLVVIGLILGAVSIGKDMQRNAEYKKIKQKFVDQWVRVYNEHYDRLGYLPGDIEAFPTMAVNGGVLTGAALTAMQTNPTSVTANGTALCNTAGATNPDLLNETFAAAGIEVPPGRGIGSESRYVYLDSNGNPQQLNICFQWRAPGQAAGVGNVLEIQGLTPDLARFLDNMIDSRVDGNTGRFRLLSTAAGATADWPVGNNRNAADSADVADTGQVIVVTALLRMNQ